MSRLWLGRPFALEKYIYSKYFENGRKQAETQEVQLGKMKMAQRGTSMKRKAKGLDKELDPTRTTSKKMHKMPIKKEKK